MKSPSLKYRHAAIVYFAYGVLYLAKFVGMGISSGWHMHGYPPIVAWIFLPLGAVLTVGFAYLVWREYRWFTRILAVVVFARAVYLFAEPNVGFFLGPFLVSAVAAWMLARAGWDL